MGIPSPDIACVKYAGYFHNVISCITSMWIGCCSSLLCSNLSGVTGTVLSRVEQKSSTLRNQVQFCCDHLSVDRKSGKFALESIPNQWISPTTSCRNGLAGIIQAFNKSKIKTPLRRRSNRANYIKYAAFGSFLQCFRPQSISFSFPTQSMQSLHNIMGV